MHRDNIARSVGLSYMFLGGYYWWGVVEIDKQTIACASVAAFIFVMTDVIQAFFEKHSTIIDKFNVSPYLMVGANTLAIMVLLIFPFADFGFEESTYDNIGTAFSLIGLGITIYLIARNNEKAIEQKTEERNEKIRQMLEECKNINNETKILMNSYNKELKEQIHAIINETSADKND